jgi:HEAT repeat protein
MMACLLALSLVALQNDPVPKETSVTEALEKFKTAYKAKDPSGRAIAVTELAKTPHEKVYAKLGALLVLDDMTVRIAAAKGLGTAAGENRKKAVNFLSHAFPANAGAPLVLSALVEAMETMQDGLGYAILKANLKSPDPQTSRAAIEAAGQIRDKSFVSPLIDHARFLEAASREALNTGPGGRTVTGGGLPGVGGVVGDPDAPKRARLLVPLIHKALESITKQAFKTVAEWADWWRRSEADFKVQK